jgi:hypothetical protein
LTDSLNFAVNLLILSAYVLNFAANLLILSAYVLNYAVKLLIWNTVYRSVREPAELFNGKSAIYSHLLYYAINLLILFEEQSRNTTLLRNYPQFTRNQHLRSIFTHFLVE